MSTRIYSAVVIGLVLLPVLPCCDNGSSKDGKRQGLFRGNLERTGAYEGRVRSGALSLRKVFTADADVLSTPAINQGIAYFTTQMGTLFAVNIAEARMLWSVKTLQYVKSDQPASSLLELSSSPSICDGVVYFGAPDGLRAVEATTGKELWTFETKEAVLSSPAVFHGVVYFGCNDGILYALEIKLKRCIWQYKSDGAIISSPAISEGRVVFGSRDGGVYAVRADNGVLLWRFAAGGEVTCTPGIGGGMVFFASGNGTFYSVCIASGKEQWKLEYRPFPCRSWTSPVVMQDGVFFAVDLNGTDGPKVEQGEIRTRGDAMVKLERETGKFAPAFTVKNSSWLPVVSSPIVVGNRLVFCDFFGIFKQVNVRTGRVVMEMHLPTSPTSSFTFVEGALYFGGDSCLYELK